MGRRWLTPERLSIFLSSRARKATRSTTSRTYLGTCSSSPSRAQPGFLLGDADAFFQRAGIVRANLRANAVFERRNDLAARRVVFRVGGEDQRDIERQPQADSL